MLYASLIGLKISLCLLLYAFSIWRLIPLGLTGYNEWCKSQKTKDLANVVVSAIFTFCFLFFIGITLVNLTFLSDDFFSYFHGVARFIFVFALTLFIAYFSFPKTIELFRKWTATRTPKYCYGMTLLGTLSIYAFLIILTLFATTKIGFG